MLMGQHLVDLVTLALGSRPDDGEVAQQRGHTQARLALMKADIADGLADSTLGIEAVARRYGLSARQAQRLFEQDGTTFTEFLLEQRLLLARKMLADPANAWRKINDIAYSAGFADVSYFNRSFRRRRNGFRSESICISDCASAPPATHRGSRATFLANVDCRRLRLARRRVAEKPQRNPNHGDCTIVIPVCARLQDRAAPRV
jgi:AraC-like DNA-binding protein